MTAQWSANSLVCGYSRSVVGFDRRVWRPVSNNFYRTSLDPVVWARAVDENPSDQNGLNLYDAPFDGDAASAHLVDSAIAAFDLPDTLVDTIKYTFGIVPASLDAVSKDASWRFLGYDIVDPRTQCSGFYSFDWTAAELTDIRERLSVTFNDHGLIPDELIGIRAATLFDGLVPPHAPFAPCGVWVKRPYE